MQRRPHEPGNSFSRRCGASTNDYGGARTVDVHVRRLRQKLGTAADVIQTVRWRRGSVSGTDACSPRGRRCPVVVDGLQAQDDLIVVPLSMLGSPVEETADRWVPAEGVHLVTGSGGRNPHVLVADPRTCRWTPGEYFTALVENTAPVYLLHREHGGTGIAPGRWPIRRQWAATGPVADRERCLDVRVNV